MRILLVDDEVELTDPLSRLLRRQGYTVDVASDGETGCEMALSGRYDLLIFDWMLPGKSGLEICQAVRTAEIEKQTTPQLNRQSNRQSDRQPSTTPVLFLTAKDTIDDRVDGLDAGADDYLVKPFELRELLARIRALLRRPTALESQRDRTPEPTSTAPSQPETNPPDTQPIKGERLVYGQLKLHLGDQLAQLAGRDIELSDKEAQLLAYLMRSPHQLLTHRQIYDAVWGKDATPSSNALAAQMRLLRKKIERPGQPTLIHTVYGKGYRFGAST